jgi:hypothetical protein
VGASERVRERERDRKREGRELVAKRRESESKREWRDENKERNEKRQHRETTQRYTLTPLFPLILHIEESARAGEKEKERGE